jgi:hypothetical protein
VPKYDGLVLSLRGRPGNLAARCAHDPFPSAGTESALAYPRSRRRAWWHAPEIRESGRTPHSRAG